MLTIARFVVLAGIVLTGGSWSIGQASAAGSDGVDPGQLAETLTTATRGSEAFNQAVETLRGLPADDQTAVAEAIVEAITGDAQRMVNFLSLLNMLNRNPVGKRLSGPLRDAFASLLEVLRDPLTKGGKDTVREAVQRSGSILKRQWNSSASLRSA